MYNTYTLLFWSFIYHTHNSLTLLSIFGPVKVGETQLWAPIFLKATNFCLFLNNSQNIIVAGSCSIFTSVEKNKGYVVCNWESLYAANSKSGKTQDAGNKEERNSHKRFKVIWSCSAQYLLTKIWMIFRKLGCRV